MAGAWVGAVLTGGASRRMGRDKATIEIEGEPMAARVAAALIAAGAAEVVTVGPPVAGLASIAEAEPGQGPLGAVVAAIRWAGGRVVLVAACDLIAPDPASFAAVVDALDAHADAAVPIVSGRAQPLAAAYSPSAVDALTAAYASGERSISAALRGLRVSDVSGIDAEAFRDADEPGDLGQ